MNKYLCLLFHQNLKIKTSTPAQQAVESTRPVRVNKAEICAESRFFYFIIKRTAIPIVPTDLPMRTSHLKIKLRCEI